MLRHGSGSNFPASPCMLRRTFYCIDFCALVRLHRGSKFFMPSEWSFPQMLFQGLLLRIWSRVAGGSQRDTASHQSGRTEHTEFRLTTPRSHVSYVQPLLFPADTFIIFCRWDLVPASEHLVYISIVQLLLRLILLGTSTPILAHVFLLLFLGDIG